MQSIPRKGQVLKLVSVRNSTKHAQYTQQQPHQQSQTRSTITIPLICTKRATNIQCGAKSITTQQSTLETNTTRKIASKHATKSTATKYPANTTKPIP